MFTRTSSLFISLTVLCLKILPKYFSVWLKQLICLVYGWPGSSVRFGHASQVANHLFHSHLHLSFLSKQYLVSGPCFLDVQHCFSSLPRRSFWDKGSMTSISFNSTPKCEQSSSNSLMLNDFWLVCSCSLLLKMRFLHWLTTWLAFQRGKSTV